MINRILKGRIEQKINSGKAIIILGARQTGKTTLLKTIFSNDKSTILLNGDEPDVISLFENSSSSRFREVFGNYSKIVIDEAQRIKNIGIKLKLITDILPDKTLVATGSSAFELANNINEPLTGRKWEYYLYPLSFAEMVNHHGIIEEKRLITHRLIYGYYPEVITSTGLEKEVLKHLTDSYLYKDLLMWGNIKKPEKLIKLLQALAFQIGNEVSYNELGQITELDNETVESYIQLLEQTFVIFRLGSFSRNLRKELKRSRKIYFFDNGIRNALIANFALPELRQDIGGLWENFLISERQKYIHYNQIWANKYFWRTHDQQEIDYIEERDGILHAFEFKWNRKRKAYLSKTFSNAYPLNTYSIINPENFDSFLINK